MSVFYLNTFLEILYMFVIRKHHSAIKLSLYFIVTDKISMRITVRKDSPEVVTELESK